MSLFNRDRGLSGVMRQIGKRLVCRHDYQLMGVLGQNSTSPKEPSRQCLVCSKCKSIKWKEVVNYDIQF